MPGQAIRPALLITMKTTIFIFNIIFLISGCSRGVARVGSIPVMQKDLGLRVKVSEIYYPGSGKPYVGLSQLIKGYLSLEILRSLGHPVDGAAIEAEAQRISMNTKAPDMLDKIKRVFGDNHTAYLNVFVKTVYAERVLYSEIFLKTQEIHIEQRRMAEKVLREATSGPSSFGKIAARYDLKVDRLKVSEKKGITRSAATDPLNRETPGLEQAGIILRAVVKLSSGAVMPQIIEWPESFQIIKLISKGGSTAVIDSVVIPKKSYDDWFWSKAATIPVLIYDSALKDELLREVSWAKNLKLD